ncbi:probable alpha-mannosidase [Tanacetum coccineum]
MGFLTFWLLILQAFFQRWWRDQSEATQTTVKGLVSSGQLKKYLSAHDDTLAAPGAPTAYPGEISPKDSLTCGLHVPLSIPYGLGCHFNVWLTAYPGEAESILLAVNEEK